MPRWMPHSPVVFVLGVLCLLAPLWVDGYGAGTALALGGGLMAVGWRDRE